MTDTSFNSKGFQLKRKFIAHHAWSHFIRQESKRRRCRSGVISMSGTFSLISYLITWSIMWHFFQSMTAFKWLQVAEWVFARFSRTSHERWAYAARHIVPTRGRDAYKTWPVVPSNAPPLKLKRAPAKQALADYMGAVIHPRFSATSLTSGHFPSRLNYSVQHRERERETEPHSGGHLFHYGSPHEDISTCGL